MIVDKHTTLAEFMFYLDVFNTDQKIIEGLFDRLKTYPIPDIFIPIDEEGRKGFDILKFKQLIDLQTGVKTFDDLLFVPFKVIHDLSKEDILTMSAFDCIRFALYAKDELERITNLFKDIEYKASPEEQRAGIGKLSHGFFGTIDWYARRMGITDHDIVTEFQWVRVYKCLKIDFDNNNFEKRYRQVINQQNKLKK